MAKHKGVRGVQRPSLWANGYGLAISGGTFFAAFLGQSFGSGSCRIEFRSCLLKKPKSGSVVLVGLDQDPGPNSH